MTTLPALDSVYPITQEHCAALHADGHVILRGLLSAAEIQAYAPAIRAYVMDRRAQMTAGEQRLGASPVSTVFDFMTAPEPVTRLVTSRRLGAVAAALLDVPAVRLFHFNGFFKPGGGMATPWHQDLGYIPMDTDRILGLWLPLVDIEPDMGGLIFGRGSHRNGMQKPAEAARYPVDRNGPLAAGDASVHLGWTLHASLPNTSDRMREVLAVAYYPDGARIQTAGRGAFAQSIMQTYFRGLEEGALAVGDGNPVVFRQQPEPPEA